MSLKKIIECKNVSFVYNTTRNSGKNVLNNINFSLYEKQMVCIVGTNGAGKSTLAKILAGVLLPTEGSIINVSEKTKVAVKNNTSYITYMQQDIGISSVVPLSVYDIVLMARMKANKFFFNQHDYKKVNDALHICAIKDLRHKNIKTLSGGQLRKVFIARMLATDSRILVLDEISTGLDLVSKNALVKLLKVIKKIKTIVFVSHDITMVSELADKIFCITESNTDLAHKMFLEYIDTHLGHITVKHLHKHLYSNTCLGKPDYLKGRHI